MRNNPREVLLGLHRRHARTWERKHLEEMRKIYAEEAIIFNTDPPAKFSDFKTFENNLQQYFAHIYEVSFLTSNIQIAVFDEVAWVTSLYLRAYRQNDRLFRESGRWTEIYEKREEEWKLVHLHASRDPQGEE